MAEQTIVPETELSLAIIEPEIIVAPPRWQHLAKITGRIAVSGACALVGAALALQASPYETSLAGVETEVRATTTPGLTLETSIGRWEAPHVTSLPHVGLVIRPTVDLENLQSVMTNTSAFVSQLETDAKVAAPKAVQHLATAAGIGLGLGGAVGALVYEAAPLLRRKDVRRRLYTATTIGAVGAGAITLAVGALTYNPGWAQEYKVTGIIANAQAVPQELQQLNSTDAIVGQQQLKALGALQNMVSPSAEQAAGPEVAYNILFISDMHLRDEYTSLLKIVADNNVAFIINTGDETETGSAHDLSLMPSYLEAIKTITAKVPMIWIKGNHDSAAVAAQMAAIPGVTVLDKTQVEAYGLTIGGLGDPIDYLDGTDITSKAATNKEQTYATDAAKTIDPKTSFDILISHEPPAADALASELGAKRVRMTIAGHTHSQALKLGDTISVVEGSTGMGGLFNLAGDTPEEFSLASVGTDCSFVNFTRFQIKNPNNQSGSGTTVQQENIDQAATDKNRVCSPYGSISSPTAW